MQDRFSICVRYDTATQETQDLGPSQQPLLALPLPRDLKLLTLGGAQGQLHAALRA